MSNARNISKAESRFVNATGDTISGNLNANGSIYLSNDAVNGPTIRKVFTTAHQASNQGANISIGIEDGSFGGMTIQNVQSSTGVNNSQKIVFGTHEGGIWAGTAMTIEPSGYVTTPRQPAFFFDLAGGWGGTPSSGDTVPWGNGYAHLNVGGSFNTSTHRFTAPTAGKYSFSVSLSPGNTSTSDRWQAVQFHKNGSNLNPDHYVLGHVTAGVYSNQYDTLSSTVVLSLSAGDYVETKFYYNGFSGNVGYGQFSGHLIG